MYTRIIFTQAINIGPGNVTQTINLDPIDITWNKALNLQLKLTTIATDAADNLDIYFQETRGNDTISDTTQFIWNTRGRFSTVLGNTSASLTAPYAEELVISQDVDLTTAERTFRPSGSSGAAELNAGTVLDGPFAPRNRTPNGLFSSHRLKLVISGDANSNASYVGQLLLVGHQWPS